MRWRATTALWLGIAACSSGQPPAPAPGDAPRAAVPPKAAPAAGSAAAGSIPNRTLSHTPGPARFLNAADACPVPPVAPLVLPKTDSWGGLITLRDASKTVYLSPVHVNVTFDGDLMMYGFSRDTGDFSPDTFNIAPTFVMKSDLTTSADVEARAEIFGVPVDKEIDSWFCGGHTFLQDGRPIVVGGTRIAKFAVQPGLPTEKRGWGLDYGAIFGPQGWVRIPRDFIGGEAWYPTITRLSDGRLIMYSGYFELDANLPEINAALQYNRMIQLFDPRDSVEPWTVVSPRVSTPVGTAPANYTWIFELPESLKLVGRDRQIFMMGGDGSTYMMNHLEPFPDPAQRFVARAPRPDTTPGVPEAGVVMLLPYYHEAEKNTWRPGSVLAVGGDDAPRSTRVDIYDPYIDKWCEFTRPLGVVRKNAAYAYLPDGNVLVINGDSVPFVPTDVSQNTPHIIDPRTGQVAFGKPEPLSTRRGYHNVGILVPDGRVFVGAGRSSVFGDPDLPDERTDARFYSPYYLGILPPSDRPKIRGIPTDPVMHYDAEYVVDYKNGEITGAALVGLPAMTHATDFNGRYVELELGAPATNARGKVTLRGPKGPTLAPPGPYMLFLLRKVNGVSVPSVAQIIRVDGPNAMCEGIPVNGCGGCSVLLNPPGAACQDICGAGAFKCDGPNKTSCNACL